MNAAVLVLLRGVHVAALILIPLLIGGFYTGAATVAFGLPFNFANVIALPLLLGIGVDYGIHLVEHACGMQTGTDDGLLCTSTARAMFLSAATTVISFGNLTFSDHRGMASVGVLLILAATLLVLPALLRVAGVSQREPC